MSCGSTADRQRSAAAQARRRDGVPELCALSAQDGLREHRVRPAHAQRRMAPRSTPRPRCGGETRHHASAAAPAEPAVGRPAPARCARSRDGAAARRVPDGRAACPISMPRCAFPCARRSSICTTQMQTTFVYVTHDQAEALTLADRIVVMNDGVIQQIGTPDDDLRAASQHVRRLHFWAIRRSTTWKARSSPEPARRCSAAASCAIALPPKFASRLSSRRPAEVVLGMRPEDVCAANGAGADSLRWHRRIPCCRSVPTASSASRSRAATFSCASTRRRGTSEGETITSRPRRRTAASVRQGDRR